MALLALSLVGVAAAHSTSIIVVGALIVLAPLVDAVRWLVERRRPIDAARAWWREGIARPLAAGRARRGPRRRRSGHLAGQAADLGSPVDYRFFDPGWLDRAAIRGYFSWEFLALWPLSRSAWWWPRADCDATPRSSAVGSLALACVVVSELWRIEFAFEYRRVVYYAGIVLVLLIGAAAVRMPRRVRLDRRVRARARVHRSRVRRAPPAPARP